MEREQMLEKMRRRGFEVIECPTGADALAVLTERVEANQSVGLGGSVSVREVGAPEALAAKGCRVVNPWSAPAGKSAPVRDETLRTDVFLCSANAVTGDGRLVFIDGTCNRVGAIVYSPSHAYFIVGENKLVSGGLQQAVARIKREACPPNARRIGLDTPCAHTGKCDESACGEACMCCATVVLDRVPRGRKMTVLLVAEKLGY